MSNFEIPPDDLLRRAMASPGPGATSPPGEGPDAGAPRDEQERGSSHSRNESDEEIENSNKRPRLDNGLDEPLDRDEAVRTRVTGRNIPAKESLTQYANAVVSTKKLTDASTRELYQFASAQPAERQIMHFGLDLELRDDLEKISNAVVSSSLHPDLLKNIKKYTAATFFSPRLTYYIAPAGSARAKALHNMILEMLKKCHIAHIPPTSDAAGTRRVIAQIGKDLTDLRSDVKAMLGKRVAGQPGMDIGSFVANVTRNASIKITAEHYARVAFLSREYRSWCSTIGPGEKGPKYWEWVDKALDNVRKETGNAQNTLNNYFRTIVAEDEALFEKPVGPVAKSGERDEWQQQVELASGKLTNG